MAEDLQRPSRQVWAIRVGSRYRVACVISHGSLFASTGGFAVLISQSCEEVLSSSTCCRTFAVGHRHGNVIGSSSPRNSMRLTCDMSGGVNSLLEGVSTCRSGKTCYSLGEFAQELWR
jgi:hypothetical protein